MMSFALLVGQMHLVKVELQLAVVLVSPLPQLQLSPGIDGNTLLTMG